MREPVQVADVTQPAAYQSSVRDITIRAGYRSALSVPLLREEEVIGTLTLTRRTPGEFAPEIVELLKTFATQSALAIQNARLFREIEDKGRELELASKHKSQFLANMSHELRTPLNAILGYTELLLDGIYGEVPEKARETMGRIERSGRHLLALINDVLDLSKIEAGQLTLSLADYSLSEIVNTVVTAMEPLAAEKGLALQVALEPSLPLARGDDRRLSQVLLNLVGNAVKFTDAGEVRIEGKVSDGAFLVSVSDTGPGIAAEHQTSIFDEFQQVDSSNTRKKGGTGLGLSIARRILALHGGRIWVESAPGEGATFSFTLLCASSGWRRLHEPAHPADRGSRGQSPHRARSAHARRLRGGRGVDRRGRGDDGRLAPAGPHPDGHPAPGAGRLRGHAADQSQSGAQCHSHHRRHLVRALR